MAGHSTPSLVDNLATRGHVDLCAAVQCQTAVGTGTLTIAVGKASTSINIDSSDNTLAGIASAINSAPNNPGVTASIITTTDGARLVLSGTANGRGHRSQYPIRRRRRPGALVYDPANGVTNLTETQAPLDASFSINGFPATSANNRGQQRHHRRDHQFAARLGARHARPP